MHENCKLQGREMKTGRQHLSVVLGRRGTSGRKMSPIEIAKTKDCWGDEEGSEIGVFARGLAISKIDAGVNPARNQRPQAVRVASVSLSKRNHAASRYSSTLLAADPGNTFYTAQLGVLLTHIRGDSTASTSEKAKSRSNVRAKVSVITHPRNLNPHPS